MNDNLSQTFNLLRFPLAVMVIYLHIDSVITPYEEYCCVNSAEWVYRYLNMSICKIATCAVPCFFLISGYLFSYNIKALTVGVYIYKIKNRIKTLLIPYILWNVLAVIYLKITNQLVDSISFYFVFVSPANFPLWFLRNLIILALIFPILYYFTRFSGKIGLLVVSLIFVIMPIPTFKVKFVLLSIYFFYCGIAMGHLGFNISNIYIRYKVLICVMSAVLLLYEIIVGSCWAWYIDNLFLVIGVLTLLIIGSYIADNYDTKKTVFLASSSFFIYASHKLGATFISKKIFDFLPENNYYSQSIIFIFSPLIAALMCMISYVVLKKTVPRILYLFTGGK